MFVSQPANYNDLKLLEYYIQYSIYSIQFDYRQFLQYSCSLNWNQMARGESGLKTDSQYSKHSYDVYPGDEHCEVYERNRFLCLLSDETTQ